MHFHLSAPRARLRLALLSLALLVVAAPASAQMIHGRLVEDGTLKPVSGATVTLLDANGRELNRVALTNETGTFFLRVEPGRYKLGIKRIQYSPLVTQVIPLKKDEIFEGTFRVSPIAVRLATQRISAKPNIEWGRDGFNRRKALSSGGVFLTRNDFDDADQSMFAYLLRKVPGLQILPDGSIRSVEGYRCLKYMVNGVPVRSDPSAFFYQSEHLFPTLEDIVPTGHDVMGIEVYREFKEVPAEYRLTAWVGNTSGGQATGHYGVDPNAKRGSVSGKIDEPCGIITVWTKAAW
jgi:hypothetical protein